MMNIIILFLFPFLYALKAIATQKQHTVIAEYPIMLNVDIMFKFFDATKIKRANSNEFAIYFFFINLKKFNIICQ